MIVILGIFNADTAYRADRMPKLGETIMGRGFSLGAGGKGSNQAVAAAKAGGDVTIVTRLGADAFADLARSTWDAAGVRQSVTVDASSHTGAAFIFLDANSGDNAIIVAAGAATKLSAADMDERAGLIGGAKVFITQLEQPIPAARRALEIAKAGGAITILNPAPAAELDDAMLALCDYLTPNESETELLTALPVTTLAEAEAAADALLARGVGAVLMTLGERGALYRDAAQSFVTAAFKVGPVAETTGAGDSFNGAFAVALSEGRPVREAIRFACATAGIQVTRPGAATAMPARAEIDAVLAANPDPG